MDLEIPSRRKVGKGGVALFWKYDVDNYVIRLNIDDDRLIGIQVLVSRECYVYIIQLYLPSSNHCMQEFEEYIFKLQDICSSFVESETLIIMGDLNAHLNCTKLIKRCDRRALLLHNFLACNNLVFANTLPTCKGANDTFVSYNGMFHPMIDDIVIPKECVDTISDCLILDDDALNVSTHRPVLCSLIYPHDEQTDIRSADITYQIKWRCVKDAKIGTIGTTSSSWVEACVPNRSIMRRVLR